MAFQVFENNKPCDINGYPIMHPSWKQSKFPTLIEATNYLMKWLGEYSDICPLYVKPNEELDIAGMKFVIKEVP